MVFSFEIDTIKVFEICLKYESRIFLILNKYLVIKREISLLM